MLLILLLAVLIIAGDIGFQMAGSHVPSFNSRVFENTKGYEYSMFLSGEWVYSTMIIKEFADWNLVLLLGAAGEKDYVYVPCMYMLALDHALRLTHHAQQITMIIDGKEYSFSPMLSKGLTIVPLGYGGREMVKSLSHAKNVELHITFEDFELHMDQSKIGDISSLVEVSKNLLAKNIWRYAPWDWMEMGDIHLNIADHTEAGAQAISQ